MQQRSRKFDRLSRLFAYALPLCLMPLNACYTGTLEPSGDDEPGTTANSELVAADRPSTVQGRPDPGDPRTWPAGEPSTRTAANVCARWNADREVFGRMPAWTAAADACAGGTLPAATREAGVRVANSFRWLAGLNPLREDRALSASSQACAVLLERNGQLSHHPANTWTCWNPVASQAAGRSNLIGARGFAMSPWAAVSGWIDEGRDLSGTLGHRRWLLYPGLQTVGYGQSAGYSCMDVVSAAPTAARRPYTAWPNAGFVPSQAVTRIWSLSSSTLGITAATRVEVTVDGARVPVTPALQARGFGEDTISWEVWPVRVGATYRVRVTGLTAGTISYDVKPVGC